MSYLYINEAWWAFARKNKLYEKSLREVLREDHDKLERRRKAETNAQGEDHAEPTSEA